MNEESDYLIVGLGNPGVKYAHTRHNLGFMVVEAFALRHGLNFKRGWRINGKVASGVVGGKKIHLLMPATYMNLSGHAVQKAFHYYKINPNRLLIVVDDVYVKFGAMRLREEGGTGGHNGLKSIQACLNTQQYPRLRMGVGPQNGKDLTSGSGMPLEEYVLAQFTAEEASELPQLVDRGASVVEEWLKLGISAAAITAGNLSKPGSQ